MLLFSLGVLLPAPSARAQERFAFDIPAQSLATALENYGEVTGRDVLYNSNLTIGRRSTVVQGRLPADTALMILLEGTGLSARHQTSGSFVLLAAPVEAAPPPAIGQYYGHIQTSLRSALCSSGETRPGNYRLAIRLWIGSAGDVVRHERLSSAGTPRLDESVDLTLRGMRIGAPPPTGLAQPVTIVIAPEALGTTMGCDAVHRAKGAP